MKCPPFGRWPAAVSWSLGAWMVLGSHLLAARVPWNTSKIQGSPEPPPLCRVERMFPRLAFLDPVDFVWESRSARYWVLEHNGALHSFRDQPDPAATDPAGDIATSPDGGKRPFKQALGFTFHPGFATNRFVYLAYQTEEATADGSRVSRFRMVDAVPPRLDLGSELPLIFWRGGGHNGCSLKFGPDGMLYISTGDSEAPEPPDRLRTGQDISDLLSSILRIDVDRTSPGKPYSVPVDNPFLGRPGARPEVWAYGFRNPWRTSFGPDGALWVGDVGWELWETIHRVTSGYNGGWSHLEGPQMVYPEIVPPTPISPPIMAHPHSEAASITGGGFYQGRRVTELSGAYIYGDWETGKIWALHPEGGRVLRHREICDTTLKVVAFASAADGEMLVLDYQEGKRNSGIYRLVRNESASTTTRFPRRLSETGLFADLAAGIPAVGVREYRPVATMWADHATSQRWLALPGDSVVTTARGHPWSEVSWAFPSNAVLAKTISLELVAGDPGSRRRLETQVLHQDGEAWQAYTYRWNAAQTDADLVPAAGDSVVLKVQDAAAPGGIREQVWRFHSRAECFRCHNFWPGTTLAFGWDSLAGKPLTGTARTELARLADLGLVRETRAPETPIASLRDPADASAPLEQRARTWLHLNCAHCHRFGAGGAVAAYFNAELTVDKLRILDLPPQRGGFGLPDPRILAPQDPWRSVLYLRASTTGGGHMPALGSRLRDEAGLTVLRDWIRTVGDATNRWVGMAGLNSVIGESTARPAGVEREGAFRAAFTNTAVAFAILDRNHRGESLRDDAVNAAWNHRNAAARDLYAHLLRPDQVRPVLGESFDPSVVLKVTGDVERGRTLFHNESGPGCARCHVSEGRGRNFGPELTGIGAKYDRATLLQHLVKPSMAIAPEFALHLVELKDGSSLSGFLVRSEPERVILVTEGGEQSWPRSDVVRMEKTNQSAMPDGLLSSLTAGEAADLLTYLRREQK